MVALCEVPADWPIGDVREPISLAELQKSAFYEEVLRPQRVAHNEMLALAARDDSRGLQHVPQFAARTAQPRRASAFSMVVTASLPCRNVGISIDGYAMQHLAFNILDRLAEGVIVLDRKARVLFANGTAVRMEGKGSLLFHPSIIAHSAAYPQRLNKLIRGALLRGT